MKVTFLVDNYVDRAGLLAEHGFSALIEVDGKNILFDAGQTGAIMSNIKFLGIYPKSIDFIVLSHGHYDHTGGLLYLNLSEHIKIYSHKAIDSRHLRVRLDGDYDYIGIDETFFSKNQHLFSFNESVSEIDKGIFLSGGINRFEEFDSDKNLFIEYSGVYSKDYFPDEQYLAIREEDGWSIITGCSHAGIVNIVKDFKSKFGDPIIKSVIGGFHLFRSGEKELHHVSDFLMSNDIKYIITGHCTGINAICHFSKIFQKRFIPIKVGLTVEI
ncbi:MBL fold metallo-hydrolase [Calditerrivibrio sp.]|uniref:MBL fold metallo-hydrolase n=1 Tax=Calditerrivibrio sp. TaxID=2792612 RepID=UPI003D0AE1E9